MNRRTRIFMLGSALVLSVGLCTGLLAYYGGLPTLASTQSSGLEELKYVPSDAAVVAYANVRDVMGSQFRQSLKGVMPAHDQNGQAEFERETGIDVEKDIHHIVACLSPSSDGEPAGFVMLRGNFNDGKLEALARQHGAEPEEFQGIRLLRLPADKHDGHRDDGDKDDDDAVESAPGVGQGSGTGSGGIGAVTVNPNRSRHVLGFVEPGLIVVGDEAFVKRTLSKQAPGLTSNSEVMDMINGVDAGANLWAVGRMEELAKKHQLPDQIAAQIPSIKWFAASSRVDGGLSATLRAEARDDEAAKNLRDVVNGFLALARLQAGSKPEYASLMQSVQLSGTGRTVALSFQLPTELMESIGKHKKAVE